MSRITNSRCYLWPFTCNRFRSLHYMLWSAHSPSIASLPSYSWRTQHFDSAPILPLTQTISTAQYLHASSMSQMLIIHWPHAAVEAKSSALLAFIMRWKVRANITTNEPITPSLAFASVTRCHVTIVVMKSIAATSLLRVHKALFILRIENMAIDSSTWESGSHSQTSLRCSCVLLVNAPRKSSSSLRRQPSDLSNALQSIYEVWPGLLCHQVICVIKSSSA